MLRHAVIVGLFFYIGFASARSLDVTANARYAFTTRDGAVVDLITVCGLNPGDYFQVVTEADTAHTEQVGEQGCLQTQMTLTEVGADALDQKVELRKSTLAESVSVHFQPKWGPAPENQ